MTKRKPRKVLYTVKEACEFLNICKATLYNFINQDKITSFKLGGRRMFTHQDLMAFVRNQREAA